MSSIQGHTEYSLHAQLIHSMHITMVLTTTNLWNVS